VFYGLYRVTGFSHVKAASSPAPYWYDKTMFLIPVMEKRAHHIFILEHTLDHNCSLFYMKLGHALS
jgi:hypothetical protein